MALYENQSIDSTIVGVSVQNNNPLLTIGGIDQYVFIDTVMIRIIA
jgi:hypothetical protein